MNLVTNKSSLINFLCSYSGYKADSLEFNGSWELLTRQARRGNLLARVAFFIDEDSFQHELPKKIQQHLLNAQEVFYANKRSVEWEVKQLYRILYEESNICFILLKGAAYLCNSNQAAIGRVFGDIDIMVRKVDLEKTERILLHNGWFSSRTFDTYDQQFYREWTHELPPLRHLKRNTELDVHHTITPPTSKNIPNIEDLWNDAVAVKDMPGVFILAPIDMILHSATHLFHEGEFENGLRDISDLVLLLGEYSKLPQFWNELVTRATAQNLSSPLFYALRYTSIILHAPIPESVRQDMQQESPGLIPLKLMDFLFLRALKPDHESCNDRWTGLAHWLLYIRSHWLRMPLHLLLPHLLRKSFMHISGKKKH